MKLVSAFRENLKENLGLKIGVLTGAAIFLMLLLLLGIVAAIQVPLISKFTMIQVLLVLAVVIATFSILVIAISTNLFIHRPLSRLMTAIRQAEAGDLKTSARVDSEDEIGQVASQFNEMLSKINELESTKIDTERKLTVAQEQLKYNAMLEEKAKIITTTNRKLEESLNELSVLYNISQALTGSIVPEELCNLLGDVIVRNVGVEDFAILLLDEESQTIEV
ncbi:MAG: HAMP domain-containing protein, partial [Deltaproteobacteria bacterium]|nr:HAMP domain-containing protein [Deltaproteobacteria bacterium]